MKTYDVKVYGNTEGKVHCSVCCRTIEATDDNPAVVVMLFEDDRHVGNDWNVCSVECYETLYDRLFEAAKHVGMNYKLASDRFQGDA